MFLSLAESVNQEESYVPALAYTLLHYKLQKLNDKNGTNTNNNNDTNKLLTYIKNSDTITIQSYKHTAHT
jgi:hypothetical protein